METTPEMDRLYARCKRAADNAGVELHMTCEEILQCLETIWGNRGVSIDAEEDSAFVLIPYDCLQPLSYYNAIPLTKDEWQQSKTRRIYVGSTLRTALQAKMDELSIGDDSPFVRVPLTKRRVAMRPFGFGRIVPSQGRNAVDDPLSSSW